MKIIHITSDVTTGGLRMNKNILEDNIKYTNQLISKILRFGILLIICVAIANYFKLFVIDMKYMLFVVGISSIVFSGASSRISFAISIFLLSIYSMGGTPKFFTNSRRKCAGEYPDISERKAGVIFL